MNAIQKLYQESIDSMEDLNAQYEHEIHLINSGKLGIPKGQRSYIISDLKAHIEDNIKAIDELKGFIKEADNF